MPLVRYEVIVHKSEEQIEIIKLTYYTEHVQSKLI